MYEMSIRIENDKIQISTNAPNDTSNKRYEYERERSSNFHINNE